MRQTRFFVAVQELLGVKKTCSTQCHTQHGKLLLIAIIGLSKTRFAGRLFWIFQAMPHNALHGVPMWGIIYEALPGKFPTKKEGNKFSKRSIQCHNETSLGSQARYSGCYSRPRSPAIKNIYRL